MKHIPYITVIFFLNIIFIGCERPEKEIPINENIIALPESLSLNNALWINDSTIFYPLGYYTITDNFNQIADHIITRKFYERVVMQDHIDDKILWVYNRPISGGSSQLVLNEYSRTTGETTAICDDERITGARYYRDSEHIIYHMYSRTEENQMLSGFYLYDRGSNTKEILLLDTNSPPSRDWTNVRGFDIHPEENKLLTLGSNYNLIEYNIDLKQIDTLDISFPARKTGGVPLHLWLRYNNSGNRVLYSHYNYATNNEWGESEVGILNMLTNEKRILDVNTNTKGKSVNIFPDWSPDNRHIVYGSGAIDHKYFTKTTPLPPMPELFILKNVDY